MDRLLGSMVLDLVQKIYELDHLDTVGVFYKGRSFVAHFTLNYTFTLDTRLFDDSLADLAVKCFGTIKVIFVLLMCTIHYGSRDVL